MSTQEGSIRRSANDRFKDRSSAVVAGALMLAVVAHAAAFELFPTLSAADLSTTRSDISVIDLPPETRIPPPPERIARPATPRVGSVEVDEDLTIAPTTFESNPASELGPPPPTAPEASDRPTFIPYDVAPRLLNKDEVIAALGQNYPRALQNTGIAGRVVVWVFIDQQGVVVRSHVQTSSGYPALDAAAQRVAAVMRFSPARNRDLPTAVWISQPINFEIVNGRGGG
jgi:TonB family protein